MYLISNLWHKKSQESDPFWPAKTLLAAIGKVFEGLAWSFSQDKSTIMSHENDSV